MSVLPVEIARERILDGVAPLAEEPVSIADAAGRVLAEPLHAIRDQPPFDACAMDGYAVRMADTVGGATLRLVGASVAGKRYAGSLGAGETVRIFTGAPVPEGADGILIQENATAVGDRIGIVERPAPGRFIRPRGLDFMAGSVLLPPGRRLGSRELALAAAANASTLMVRRRPLVAFLSIGDELVLAGRQPGPDQIVASSAAGLVPMVRDAGADAVDLGLIGDCIEDLVAATGRAEALGVDVLVTLGGASVGDHDLVRPALASVGMELEFWRIAMRPGRPMLFGRLPPMRVLGLPGNPVSSLVCSLLFLVPLVEALLGMPFRDRTEPAILAVDVEANDGREDYVRSLSQPQDGGLPGITPLSRQDSSMLRALADADCLLIRPIDAPAAGAGTPCRILRLF